MIYDGGVDRTNFDSSGLSTGYQESLLMTDIEGEILSLIKGQFESVKDRDVSELGSDWQAEQLRQAESLKKRFVAAFANRQAEIMQGIKTSITNGFAVGVQTSKRELSVVGFEYPDREYNLAEAKQGENTILNSFNSVLQAEAQAVSFALGAFVTGVGMIAAATSGKVSQVYDNTVVPELEKGLVGKVTANGAHLELSSYVEGVTRETSQQALLMGESVVANAAGQYLVRISSHQSCCPKCQPYQGQILIDDVFADGKPDGVHELLSTAIANGLFHWNCRHKKTIWIPGKTTEQAQHKQYDDKKVATNYEIEQAQRALEREIRKQKRIASTSLDPINASKAKEQQEALQAYLNKMIQNARKSGYDVYRQPHKEGAGFEFENKAPYDVATIVDNAEQKRYNIYELTEKEVNIQYKYPFMDIVEGEEERTVFNEIYIDKKQFGKKIGKHTQEFGLDPSSSTDREIMENKIHDFFNNPDEIKVGDWRGRYVYFFIKGNDLLLVDRDGEFISIFPNAGKTNKQSIAARTIASKVY